MEHFRLAAVALFLGGVFLVSRGENIIAHHQVHPNDVNSILAIEPPYDYRFPCGKTPDVDDCDHRKNLVCTAQLDGKSICTCPSDAWYYDDKTLMTCVARAGKECREVVHDGTYPTTCTVNAYCNQQETDKPGICVCHDGSIPTSLGQCKSGFGGVCNIQTDCSMSAFLKCDLPDQKLCICDEGNLAKWDAQTLKCLSLFGGKCDDDATNARTCFQGPVQGLECSATEKVCKCKGALVETPNGDCLNGYVAECVDDNQCHPNFHCVPFNSTTPNPKICACRNTEHYDATQGICLQRAGQSCIPSPADDSGNHKKVCVDHSECLEVINGEFTCSCVEGYSANGDNFCLGELDATCSAIDECRMDKYLDCKNNKCACKDNYEANGQGICIGNIDAECEEDSGCQTGFCDPDENLCKCPVGTVQHEATCVVGHEAQCGSEGDWGCNPTLFLRCVGGQCGCEENMAYDPINEDEKDKCVTLVGGSCNINAGKVCTKNSTCVNVDNQPVCNCNNGYQVNELARCDEIQKGGDGGSGTLTSLSMGLSIFVAMCIVWNN